MVLSLHHHSTTGSFRDGPMEGAAVRAVLTGLVALNIAGLIAMVVMSVAR